jgi:hypothetical protein
MGGAQSAQVGRKCIVVNSAPAGEYSAMSAILVTAIGLQGH